MGWRLLFRRCGIVGLKKWWLNRVLRRGRWIVTDIFYNIYKIKTDSLAFWYRCGFGTICLIFRMKRILIFWGDFSKITNKKSRRFNQRGFFYLIYQKNSFRLSEIGHMSCFTMLKLNYEYYLDLVPSHRNNFFNSFNSWVLQKKCFSNH